MNNCFEKDYLLNIESCSNKCTISPLAVFTLFQAITTLHGESLGINTRPLSQGKFWVITHNRVDFFNTAFYLDTVNVKSWLEMADPADKRFYRGYRLTHEDDLIALARTQFAVMDEKGQILTFNECGLPQDIRYSKETGIQEEPTHFIDDFIDKDFLFNYLVKPTDIDFGNHLNNVKAIRILLDTLTGKQLANNSIRSIEAHYSAQCFEGESLALYCIKEPKKLRFALKKADGKTAILAHILFYR